MRLPLELKKNCKALRRELTIPENLLWQRLRRKDLAGFKFRRQHPIYPYILDFFCAAKKLAIEIDGDSHLDPEQQVYDKRRTFYLNKLGITVLRYSNNQVQLKFEEVIEDIKSKLKS